MIKSQLGPADAARLPQFDMVKHSGVCLARFSLKAMIIKKWKPTFWIAYGDNQIIFFRSKSDFEEWISNPFLKENERKQLVKCKIDFVTDLEQPLMKGYSVSQTSSKAYARDGYMTHFKVEKWDNFGPTIFAALGGKNEIEVNSLRTIMKEMIAYSPQMLRALPSGSSDGSSFHSSGVSDFGSVYTSPSAAGEHSQIDAQNEDAPKKKRSSFSFRKSSKESNDVDSAAATAQIPYTYDYGNAGVPSSFLYDNGDGRSRPKERSDSKFRGMLRSKSKEPKKAIDDSNATASDPNKKSSSRLKGMLRSKSKDPKQPSNDAGAETKRAKSRMRVMTRSKSREPAGETNDSNGKEPKSILKKMAFKKKKKKKSDKEEDVQYYVGRPSTQEEFGYRPAEVDYGI